jgi:antirestriction protein ArdC
MKVFKCWKRSKTMQEIIEKKDVYARITSQIVAQLEKGVRPWSKPWNAEHAAGRITRPLRHNGQPYSGINILSLWMSAELQGFAAPIWMTVSPGFGTGRARPQGRKGLPGRLRQFHHAHRT